jgi:hypothetical protein
MEAIKYMSQNLIEAHKVPLGGGDNVQSLARFFFGNGFPNFNSSVYEYDHST